MINADVSVIIPCYNSSATLGRALQSIARQTQRPREVIVVDDGSSDDVGPVVAIAQSQADSYSIHLIKNTSNLGASAARNLGWESAKASLIAFLDADDEWLPEKIERQFALMRDNPLLTISGHTFTESMLANTVSRSQPRTSVVSLQRLLFRCVFPTPSVMVKRDIKQRFNTQWTHSEDYLLWMEIVAAHGPALLIKEPLVRLHKPAFGASGLSADTLQMHEGQMNAYKFLSRNKTIKRHELALAMFWSYSKYLRRRVILLLRSLQAR